MLTEEQLNVLSDTLAPLFEYLEQEIIDDCVRRIKKTMTYTRTAELYAQDMARLGFSPQKIRTEALKKLNADKKYKKIVDMNTLEYKREIAEIIDNIVKKAVDECDEIVANAGRMAWVDDLSVWESAGVTITDDGTLATLSKAMSTRTTDGIINLSKTSGFKNRFGFESSEDLYRTELNKAVTKLMSGAFSQEQVIRDVVRELGQSGLRSVDYSSGRTMQIDSAVRLAIRTGCHQLSGEIQKDNVQKTGVNLIYVTEHENARNKGEGVQNHEAWQGKVYRISGTAEEYEEEAKRIGQNRIDDLWEVTGYSIDDKHESNPLGLYGYNCRHTTYPFFEGMSEKPEALPIKPTIEYKGKELDGYAQTQELRKQERIIRNLKRELEAVKRLNMPSAELTAMIKARTTEYKAFCEKCGIPYSASKLRYEANTSDITRTKAYEAYQKMIEAHTTQ